MSVLVVDDNIVTATVLKDTLNENNYAAVAVHTGADALQYLKDNPQVQAVIVDLMMPEMDGVTLIRKIKQDPEIRDVPIVVCSAMGDVETVRKVAKIGVRHYVLKPVTEQQLLAKMKHAMDEGLPPVEHMDTTKKRLALDDEGYQRAATAFAKILHQRMDDLDSQLETQPANAVKLELTDIMEDAVLFGGKRLLKILPMFPMEANGYAGKPKRTDWLMLYREMKVLQIALQPKQSTYSYST